MGWVHRIALHATAVPFTVQSVFDCGATNGTATISSKGSGLWMSFDQTPRMEGPLTHVADDTFKVVWGDKIIEPAYVKFEVASGRIEKLEMRPASPLADFSFDYQDLRFARSPR